MQPQPPQQVLYFIGALYSRAHLLVQAKKLCAHRIAPLDMESASYPFEDTHYYDEEMGAGQQRHFFSFARLMSPGRLAALKIICNEIEDALAVNGKRKVNLDVGYMDFHKLVLASAKYNGQKVYLDLGIYADTTLVFESGAFRALENTFPDFSSSTYHSDFLRFRQRYKELLKTHAH